MTSALRGPGGRYTVSIEVLTPVHGQPVAQRRTTTGTPFQGAGSSPFGYLVTLAGCSLVLIPGETGLTVRDLKLKARQATVSATVTAAAGAPAWLPAESRYVLFSGDRSAAAATRERSIPFSGAPGPRSEQQQEGDRGTALDLLAAAVGRAVARANTDLGAAPAGMTALISRVTVRLALESTDLRGGEVQVVLGRTPGTGGGQFVEFTVCAVPAAGDGGATAPAASMPAATGESADPSARS